MENHVLFRYHNEMNHIGADKIIDTIRRTVYWFPQIREKCKNHVKHCLKCVSFSPPSGKSEGYKLNSKRAVSRLKHTHIDHFGLVDKNVSLKKYIFLIVDAFSKYVKLYPIKTTNSTENSTLHAIACLK